MEPRKIIKFGNSSHVVTLPQEWLEVNNLKKGDSLNIIEKPKSLLITMQNEKIEKKAQISIDNKPLKLFNKELLSYYLKNYKIIEIVGDDIHQRLDEITRFKEKISSVEITEITKDKIVLRDLTSPSELNLNQLIKEIIDMQNLFFEKLCQENVKEQYSFLIQLDKNINKLSFLSHKAINHNLESLEDTQKVAGAVHYWRITSNLEEQGDILKRIARYLKNESNEHNHFIAMTIEKLKEYFIFITRLLETENIEDFDKNLEIYLDKKQTLLREIEELRGKLLDDLNLFLVISQLFKDILGKLDSVILSIIDLKLK